MANDPRADRGGADRAGETAAALVERAPRDVVFSLSMVGESREILLRHFETLIRAEIERRGGAPGEDLVRPFIDAHAAQLRDFVLAGVSLSRQMRLEQIERLLGDSDRLTRVDLWDALRAHIAEAERRFHAEAQAIPALLAELGDARAAARGPR